MDPGETNSDGCTGRLVTTGTVRTETQRCKQASGQRGEEEGRCAQHQVTRVQMDMWAARDQAKKSGRGG